MQLNIAILNELNRTFFEITLCFEYCGDQLATILTETLIMVLIYCSMKKSVSYNKICILPICFKKNRTQGNIQGEILGLKPLSFGSESDVTYG